MYFWPLLFLSTLIFIPVAILRMVGASTPAERLVNTTVTLWCRHMLWMLGARSTVTGQSNVPADPRLCVIANHQSYGDSLVIQGYLGRTVGFVAKHELSSVPALSQWMRAVHTVYVKRGVPGQARRTLVRAAANISNGYPMAIFPEGTRSRGGPVGMFKAAALRVAWDSDATVLPVSISGTADLLERQGYLKSAGVQMVIHPPLRPEAYKRSGRHAFAVELREIIAADVHVRE